MAIEPKTAQPADRPGATTAPVTTVSPGYKTTEFWLSLVVGAAPYFIHALPPTWQAAISAATAAVYSLSRGLAKLGGAG